MMRERSSPDAGVRVKPIMTLSALNIDASKYGKEQISCTVQEMFEEADMWLVSDEVRSIHLPLPYPAQLYSAAIRR